MVLLITALLRKSVKKDTKPCLLLAFGIDVAWDLQAQKLREGAEIIEAQYI